MQIEDAAFGEAAEQGLAHLGRIDAGELGQTQRLCHGINGLGNDELVGELGHLAAAGGADVGDVFAPPTWKHRQGRAGNSPRCRRP
jgi:hypothetical protein